MLLPVVVLTLLRGGHVERRRLVTGSGSVLVWLAPLLQERVPVIQGRGRRRLRSRRRRRRLRHVVFLGESGFPRFLLAFSFRRELKESALRR